MKSKVIVCKEIKYAEFPDLLTGADQEGNRYADMTHFLEKKGKTKVCQNSHLLFYAQSPDFHKLGLCYNLKILYL